MLSQASVLGNAFKITGIERHAAEERTAKAREHQALMRVSKIDVQEMRAGKQCTA